MASATTINATNRPVTMPERISPRRQNRSKSRENQLPIMPKYILPNRGSSKETLSPPSVCSDVFYLLSVCLLRYNPPLTSQVGLSQNVHCTSSEDRFSDSSHQLRFAGRCPYRDRLLRTLPASPQLLH